MHKTLFVAAALLAQQGLAPADSHSDLAVPEYSQQWEEPPRARQGDSNRGKPQWNYKLVTAMNPHDTESQPGNSVAGALEKELRKSGERGTEDEVPHSEKTKAVGYRYG